MANEASPRARAPTIRAKGRQGRVSRRVLVVQPGRAQGRATPEEEWQKQRGGKAGGKATTSGAAGLDDHALHGDLYDTLDAVSQPTSRASASRTRTRAPPAVPLSVIAVVVEIIGRVRQLLPGARTEPEPDAPRRTTFGPISATRRGLSTAPVAWSPGAAGAQSPSSSSESDEFDYLHIGPLLRATPHDHMHLTGLDSTWL